MPIHFDQLWPERVSKTALCQGTTSVVPKVPQDRCGLNMLRKNSEFHVKLTENVPPGLKLALILLTIGG
jgi:hypothetical protein